MNDKERFVRKMHFEKTDRLPLYEWLGFADDTLERWYTEGLPMNTSPYDYFMFDRRETIGTTLGRAVITHPSLAEDLYSGPIPPALPRTIEETDRYKTIATSDGSVVKILKASTSPPMRIAYPVKTKDDFERIRKRYDPENQRRLPRMWGDELIEYYKTAGCPLGLVTPGLFGFVTGLMGFTGGFIAMQRQPNLVHDMLDFRLDFSMRLIEPIVSRLKSAGIQLDFAHLGATSGGPMLSPRLFKEFISPREIVITNFLRKNGVDILISGGHGNISPLIPCLLDLGINTIRTGERVAGFDAVKLREEYGKELLFLGNFNVRTLLEGEDAIEKEFAYQLPMAKEGGYVFGIDSIIFNVPFKGYLYYANLLRQHLYD